MLSKYKIELGYQKPTGDSNVWSVQTGQFHAGDWDSLPRYRFFLVWKTAGKETRTETALRGTSFPSS